MHLTLFRPLRQGLDPKGRIEGVSTAISNKISVPFRFQLLQNYPNPFNPTTVIKYSIPQAEHVLLNVYNALGQKVATLEDDVQNPGAHSVVFNGSNLASGIYFYLIQAGSYKAVKKLTLLR